MQEEAKIFFEQYRDTNNPALTGYILRWKLEDGCVHVDAFQADGCDAQNDAEGWRTGLICYGGDNAMIGDIKLPIEPTNVFDTLNPNFHVYTKYDGTVHAWSENYFLGGGDAADMMMLTDMLRYITTRSAHYVQEMLNRRPDNTLHLLPLNYASPTIEVRPFTPEYWTE